MQTGDPTLSEYRRQIDSDLARRSSTGGFVYLGFVLALWATTDYFFLYPKALAVLSAFSAVCAGMRLYLGRRFQSLYARNPRGWRTAYFLSVNLNILAWGLLLAITFLRFGYEDWKTLLLLICMAGTAPIALASLSPDLLVLRVFLFALSLPMICANLYLGGTRGYSMAMVFGWYLLFATIHAYTIHRQYMQYTREKFALTTANKVKAEFLAHMSHELKTPMNAIFGMTHLAMNCPGGADQQQYLRAVNSSAEVLLKMLDGLLDFSRIEAGKVELENVEFSLRDLVDETLQSFSGDLQRKGLRLESRVDEDVPSRLRGDPLRLRQVLVNVLGNAVKFTSVGGIEARISRLNGSGGPVTLQFMVRDTGIGIAPEKHRSIFEAFEQADSSTTRKYGGSGLGLAISSRILELMGGRMWVESEPGRGSSFYWTATFTPVVIEELEPVRDSEIDMEAHTPARVLIAEDHELSRGLLKKLLEMRDHTVTAVANGREVLEVMERQSFDIILMDVHMPELDGVEATVEIRRQEHGAPPIPIVAVTADAAESLREYYLVKGFTDYLAKPIKPEALFALIDSLAGSCQHRGG